MPLLIDPPSVSRSQAATRPCPPSAVFRATSAVSPPSLLSRSGASSRARNVAVVRGRSLSQRGQPRSHNARKVTGARCGSCVRPPLISRTPFPPSPPTLCRPPFCLPLAPVWGLVLSRRVRRAAPPRKSTTGGRSRTVAPEPQQPATHDPTDPLHLSTSVSSPRCCYHPCSVAVLHPPRCVDLSPLLYLPPPSFCVCLALLSQLRVPQPLAPFFSLSSARSNPPFFLSFSHSFIAALSVLSIASKLPFDESSSILPSLSRSYTSSLSRSASSRSCSSTSFPLFLSALSILCRIAFSLHLIICLVAAKSL